MAQSFPYTYYACSCYETVPSIPSTLAQKRASEAPETNDEDDHNFNPQSARANYSLFPIEHLLYCADCREVRCPRCITEEVLSWLCPSCQLDAGSPATRDNWNRCQRACLNCPICTSNLTVSSLKPSVPAYLLPEGEDSKGPGGPFTLECLYCHWTSLDIGIELEKSLLPVKQLQEIRNGGMRIPSLRERDRERNKKIEMLDKRRFPADYRPEERLSESDGASLRPDNTPFDAPAIDEHYLNLLAFYKSQMTREKNASETGRHSKYLNRLLSSTGRSRMVDSKPRTMTEARNIDEGLSIIEPHSETDIIKRMKETGWIGTASPSQRLGQLNPHIRFTEELRPAATILRTKRTKRCRTCRQILSRPESKATSHRYKIKLLALNQIPRISLRALAAYPLPFPNAPLPPGFAQFDYSRLTPLAASQYLLTLTNPLFDPIKVTLATPASTPGRTGSKVTILCPQFEVGANTDVWEEALSTKRLAQSGTSSGQAEAGKVWDKGRNWTSIILEIVPGVFDSKHSTPGVGNSAQQQVPFSPTETKAPGAYPKTPVVTTFDNIEGDEKEEIRREEEQLKADEDVLEVPLFVRIEYEAAKEVALGTDIAESKTDAPKGREKREEAFWCVLGAGKIALPR